MNLVMTVIAGPGAAGGLADLVAALAASLPLAGAPDWLAPGMACDLRLTGIARQAADAAARRQIGGAAIDVVVQPAAASGFWSPISNRLSSRTRCSRNWRILSGCVPVSPRSPGGR
jgi:hypothetical protein